MISVDTVHLEPLHSPIDVPVIIPIIFAHHSNEQVKTNQTSSNCWHNFKARVTRFWLRFKNIFTRKKIVKITTPSATKQVESHSCFRGLRMHLRGKNIKVTPQEREQKIANLKQCMSNLNHGDALVNVCGRIGHTVITFFDSNRGYVTLHTTLHSPVNVNIEKSLKEAAEMHAEYASLKRPYISPYEKENTAIIEGMNTSNMLKYINNDLKNFHYSIISSNCARLVANILLAGVPDDVEKNFIHNRCFIQTPQNTLSLAREINRAIAEKQQERDKVIHREEII